MAVDDFKINFTGPKSDEFNELWDALISSRRNKYEPEILQLEKVISYYQEKIDSIRKELNSIKHNIFKFKRKYNLKKALYFNYDFLEEAEYRHATIIHQIKFKPMELQNICYGFLSNHDFKIIRIEDDSTMIARTEIWCLQNN